MRELRDINAFLLAHPATPCAMATVVSATGSNYRRAGSRMLIAPGHPSVGCISGGCLEREVVLRARISLSSGKAELLRFDTRADVESEFPYASGCGGVVDVFVQPLLGERRVMFERLIRLLLLERHQLKTACVVRSASAAVVGACAAMSDRGSVLQTIRAFEPLARLLALGEAGLHTTLEGDLVYVEKLLPPQRLVLFGAGADVAPMITLGKTLGWHVTVVDCGSSQFAAERTAACTEYVRCSAKEAVAAAHVQTDDALVLMTHNYFHDLDILRGLGARPRYCGLLGSSGRSARLLAEAGGVGGICTPAGLDLGGEDPATIALSIVAEIQKTITRSTGHPLASLAPAHVHYAPVHDLAGGSFSCANEDARSPAELA